MNGGVVHALECMSQHEVAAAVAGFNYFGLAEAARVFQQLPDGTDETEKRLNELYWAVVPSDETLAHAFRVKLLALPAAFAPTDSGTHA